MAQNDRRTAFLRRSLPPSAIDVDDVQWAWSGAVPYGEDSPRSQLLGGIFNALSVWVRTGEIAVLYSFELPLLRFWMEHLDGQQYGLRREVIDSEQLRRSLEQWQIRPTGLHFVVLEVAHFDATLHPSPDLFSYEAARPLWNRCTSLFVWFLPEEGGCVVAEFSDRATGAVFRAIRGTNHQHRVESYLDSLFEAVLQWLEEQTDEQVEERYEWLMEPPIVRITPIPESGLNLTG